MSSFVANEEPNDASVTNQPAKNTSVIGMVDEISSAVEGAVSEIEAINSETRVLAMNARIEAAHAGSHGAAFGIVAEHMQHLAHKTSSIAKEMSFQTRERTPELRKFITTTVKGTRLSDIALTNIDLIDRNLYERTCDVRWWATDSSLVDALTKSTPEACKFASHRMGVILGAYTVYLDLVLCDENGQVVANASPNQYHSMGSDQSNAPWFRDAMKSKSGDDYAFQTAHRSALVADSPALVYSCAVREGGSHDGKAIGALGILFNWYGLAKPIFEAVPLPQEEKALTRCMIVSADQRIVASDGSEDVNQKLNLQDFDRVRGGGRSFFQTRYEGKSVCVGHAHAPGFETYSTDWYSLVMQQID